MGGPRPTQFGLFGGAEDASDDKASDGKTRGESERPHDDQWVYPPDAFPADPWAALRTLTAREFEEALATASPDSLRLALLRYFKRGFAASYNYGELIDLLCVSNDLLAEAGFTVAHVNRILVDVLPTISEREISSMVLRPTDIAFSLKPEAPGEIE